MFQALTRFYASTLRVVLDHQGITLLVALGTFLLTGYLYVTIPKGFFPIQDTGVIQGVTQAAEDISFDQMAAHQQALARRSSPIRTSKASLPSSASTARTSL